MCIRDRSIPGDTCTERVFGVFGCSRVECLEGVTCVSRRDAWGLVWSVSSLLLPHRDARCISLYKSPHDRKERIGRRATAVACHLVEADCGGALVGS
eukprot:1762158-Prymnesium_polylepis.1